MRVLTPRRVVSSLISVLVAAILIPAAQAQSGSVLITPANGTVVSPQNIQFSWTAVSGVINYTLWIGTTAGAKDALYYSTSHASNPAGITSTSASLQPGTTYYATLWTLTSAGSTPSTSTFQTSATSYLTAPVNGATVSPQNIQFSWTAVPGVINYTLWIGTTAGAMDALYYSTGDTSNPTGITSTSAALQPGTTYYATLWTLTSAGSTTSTSTFHTSATSCLTAPLSGATVSPQNIQFSWTAVPGVIKYTLWIGTTPKAKDALYYTTSHASNPAGVTSTATSLLPGVTYYATLWTLTSAGSTISTSTFQTSATSYLTAPVNGATVSPQNIQFSWTAVPGVINYTLWIGTTAGAMDALNYSTGNTSNPTGITSTSATLQSGTTYYATLWTLTSAGSTSSTSTFQTAATSYLTAPVNGATVSPQNIQFSWTAVPGVINYTLWIGTTPKAKDALYYTTGNTSNPSGITSTSASLQPGTTYYATVWTLTSAGSTPSTSTFQTAATSYLTTPVNGATVSPQNIQFSWTAVPGVINYTLWIGTTAGAKDALYYTTGNTSNPSGITSTSAKLNPGVTYYATLWTLTSAGSIPSTSTFQTSATSYLAAPANGATGFTPEHPVQLDGCPGGDQLHAVGRHHAQGQGCAVLHHWKYLQPFRHHQHERIAAAGHDLLRYALDADVGGLYYFNFDLPDFGDFVSDRTCKRSHGFAPEHPIQLDGCPGSDQLHAVDRHHGGRERRAVLHHWKYLQPFRHHRHQRQTESGSDVLCDALDAQFGRLHDLNFNLPDLGDVVSDRTCKRSHGFTPEHPIQLDGCPGSDQLHAVDRHHAQGQGRAVLRHWKYLQPFRHHQHERIAAAGHDLLRYALDAHFGRLHYFNFDLPDLGDVVSDRTCKRSHGILAECPVQMDDCPRRAGVLPLGRDHGGRQGRGELRFDSGHLLHAQVAATLWIDTVGADIYQYQRQLGV